VITKDQRWTSDVPDLEQAAPGLGPSHANYSGFVVPSRIGPVNPSRKKLPSYLCFEGDRGSGRVRSALACH
jgi:hypothetical protein